MASPLQPNPAQPLVVTDTAVSFILSVGIPRTGDQSNGRCPLDLRAVSWPGGRRIDLFWRNPDDVKRIIIKRGRVGHSAFLLDEKDVIYDGPPVTHFIDGRKLTETIGHPDFKQTPPTEEIGIPATGVDLEEDVYFYYTFYMTIKDNPVGIFDFGLEPKSDCQVTGLSLLDFQGYRRPDSGEESVWYGEYLYKRFSAETRERDLADAKAFGRGDRGYFQDFCLFVQGGLNIFRGNARALLQLNDVDKTPAGLTVSPFDQPVILAAWARRFNIEPERHILDVEILRRIAASMIFLYKEKGTCPGLVDWTKVLTLWDSICTEVEDDTGGLCNPIFLSTWDGETTKTVIERQWSLVIASPGSVTIPGAGLVPGAHVGSVVVDSMWNQFQILENTGDSITFRDGTEEVSPEDTLSISVVNVVGGTEYLLTVTRTSGGPVVVNDNEYAGYKLVDSANTLMDVTSVVADAPAAGTSQILVDSPSPPVPGNAASAYGYILGATFDDRDPVFRLCVFTGCPTFLYDPLMDVDLRDVFDGFTLNPHDILYSGSSLIGVPFVPGDTILSIPNVAQHIGTVTSVSGNTLTDDDANFGPPGSLVESRLNPNQNARYYFKIVANTPTTITVESFTPGVQLENVSAENSQYSVLEFEDWRRYEILSRLIELFVPVTTRLFLFFV